MLSTTSASNKDTATFPVDFMISQAFSVFQKGKKKMLLFIKFKNINLLSHK